MTRTIAIATACILGVFLAAAGTARTEAAASSGQHDYFDALVRRADHWKSYSLRNKQQVEQFIRRPGQYMNVLYDPAIDDYWNRQDAAKVRVPEFDPDPFSQLARPLGLGDTSVVLTATDAQMSSRLANRRSLRIGSEVMTINQTGAVTNSTITVSRGQNGTAAASHAAGATVLVSSNIAHNNIRFPLGTAGGNSYLFTWDAWFGPEFDFDNAGIGNYKTFQFGAPEYFFQVDTNFIQTPGADFADIGAHSYDNGRPKAEAFGPNISDHYPVRPQAAPFRIHHSRWTRYWVYIEQNATGWDPLTMWVADENQGPVKVFAGLQFNVPGSITQFILEFSTSTNPLMPRGTMVAYVRNFVALLNPPPEPVALLLRPAAGVPPTDTRPAAPSNLRIIPGG